MAVQNVDVDSRDVIAPVRTTAQVLAIVGAINWGLVALFRFDAVAALFGRRRFGDIGRRDLADAGYHEASSPVARIVYGLVGVSGLLLALAPPVRRLGGVVRPRLDRARDAAGDLTA